MLPPKSATSVDASTRSSPSANQKRELQPEQSAAAYELSKHISVTAGPGSGKTTVLVERYLEILRQNPSLNIDQVVAITFTNRAANEMRERLRAELNQILLTASVETRKVWLNYKRTLDGAVITTIHGFCARLLREYPVEARIDPQFLLLDEHRAAMLLESVVEETLSEFIVAGHAEISRLTLGVGRGKLAEALAQLYREVRGQGLSFEELARSTAESHATEEQHAQAMLDLTRAMENFFVVRRTTPVSRAKHLEAIESWRYMKADIGALPGVDELAGYCRRIEDFRKVRPQARDALKGPVEAIDELVWEKNLAGLVPQIALDLFAKQYALELALLLREIDERLTGEKQRLAALDFDDLELRALELLQRPEVITRAAERYKFFLVDEFQDTNGLQRKLLEKLALRKDDSANLFIVGDSKQSIYGFRGADVTVFSEMTKTLLAAGGESKPLLLNFRSQPPLIEFFNHLFARLFEPDEEVPTKECAELGYVAHEPSDAKRELRDSGPLVELMITTEAARYDDEDPKADQNSRELDAAQLALRIASLVEAENGDSGPPKYSDIALLFRAMTHVDKYESAFRRANIPYQTVLGRGFYEREEITDLIKLLRFLDNKTDELALAAVLRSPLCGISDNALLALRCAPWLHDLEAGGDPLKNFSQTRNLYSALRQHRKIAFISDDEHLLLERAANLTARLIARQHQYSLSSLLRFAVEESEFMTVIAATFDGAQRLANVQRLFTLAERFERSGAHLIRDFVRYVEEFEAIGSRESEGQIDEAANAVRLMTVHQAKGLEFPIVIIPDLQRLSKPIDNWVLLDRKRGLTLKVPDGRGNQVAGLTFSSFQKRHEWREQFESMRLLYVAATRAQDRLILSGTTRELDRLGTRKDTWLGWIWQSLAVPFPPKTGVIDLTDDLQLQVTVNLADEQPAAEQAKSQEEKSLQHIAASAESIPEAFPLLAPVKADSVHAVHRFSVTQLINYQRCPRQYYFDRVLHAPANDALAVWNEAEAPEPPANLTATLKGAVIHRFCEIYKTGESAEEILNRSFTDVLRSRQAELADRLVEINKEEALRELLPLAQNYLGSAVFERVERARAATLGSGRHPRGDVGLWSELSFRLRRPLGILSGAIDKLLITPDVGGKDLIVEVIDFKTNRLRLPGSSAGSSSSEAPAALVASPSAETSRSRSRRSTDQIAFDFNAPPQTAQTQVGRELSCDDQVQAAAVDYQLQMQAYVLAVRELLPSLAANSTVTSTLHFLEPDAEVHLSPDLLANEACSGAIDEAMIKIVSSGEPAEFPVRPAAHCRTCNFASICAAGREWLKSRRQSDGAQVNLAALQPSG
ncbi:MAG TPA: UvrD-helicase domain-containing protein [Pyrinomonadaceae bacterium]|nr:UvrD-helicase domain-containing protein [Pyrinomonadaceae bacterium]